MSKRKHMTLSEWCKASGLHYTELAAKFDLSVSQYYRVRDGGTQSADTAKRIEKATDGKVRAVQIMGLEAI